MAANPALWADVRRDLASARDSCSRAAARAKSLEDHGDAMDPDARFDRELAVGTLLHDCYTAMETTLERLIDAVDGDRPKGGEYHAQLIQRGATKIDGVRAAMITEATTRDLHALRSFRHAMRHAYGAFEYRRAAPNVAIATRAVPRFASEIEAFLNTLERGGGETEPRSRHPAD